MLKVFVMHLIVHICCRYWQDLDHKFAYCGEKMMDWIFVHPLLLHT